MREVDSGVDCGFGGSVCDFSGASKYGFSRSFAATLGATAAGLVTAITAIF